MKFGVDWAYHHKGQADHKVLLKLSNLLCALCDLCGLGVLLVLRFRLISGEGLFPDGRKN